jgi:hypothetical protein
VDLATWQFCTHDEDETRLYAGLTTLTRSAVIAAGASLYLHFNDDAPAGDPVRFNRSELRGGFATPLAPAAYGVALYFPPVVFGDGSTMADYVQWRTGEAAAADRVEEAVAGGLWTDAGAWVGTTASTLRIVLSDASGGVLHSPADYAVENGVVEDGLLRDALAGLRSGLSARLRELQPCLDDRACPELKARRRQAKSLLAADRLLGEAAALVDEAEPAGAAAKLSGAAKRLVRGVDGGADPLFEGLRGAVEAALVDARPSRSEIAALIEGVCEKARPKVELKLDRALGVLADSELAAAAADPLGAVGFLVKAIKGLQGAYKLGVKNACAPGPM